MLHSGSLLVTDRQCDSELSSCSENFCSLWELWAPHCRRGKWDAAAPQPWQKHLLGISSSLCLRNPCSHSGTCSSRVLVTFLIAETQYSMHIHTQRRKGLSWLMFMVHAWLVLRQGSIAERHGRGAQRRRSCLHHGG